MRSSIVPLVEAIPSAVLFPLLLFGLLLHLPLVSPLEFATTVSPNGNNCQECGKAPECERVTTKIDPVFPSHLVLPEAIEVL